MCSTGNLKQDWKREPDSRGDWLWVRCFSCGCVIESGFAMVEDPDWMDKGQADYVVNGLLVCFESVKPKGEFKHIDTWLKVTMPTEAWFDLETEDPQGDYPSIKEPV